MPKAVTGSLRAIACLEHHAGHTAHFGVVFVLLNGAPSKLSRLDQQVIPEVALLEQTY